MGITELLVTGYDNNEPLFAVGLAPEVATTVHTAPDADRDPAVESVAHQPTDVFTTVRDLIQGLAATPA